MLFLIDLSTRRVEIAGLAKRANGLWMSQVARNLNDAEEGFLIGKRYLIHDRDPLFTAEFLETLGTSGVKSVKLPPRSPNLNAHAERFVRTIKESCLERMILFGEGSLRKALHEFIVHYHRERNHQGLGNRLIIEEEPYASSVGVIQCRQRLCGMLNYYYHQGIRTSDSNQPLIQRRDRIPWAKERPSFRFLDHTGLPESSGEGAAYCRGSRASRHNRESL